MKLFARQTHTPDEGAAASPKLFLFLLIDATVYFAAFYFVQLFNLLHFDGSAGGRQYGIVAAACFTTVFLLALAHQRIHGRFSAFQAAAEAALFLFIALAPLIFMESFSPRKGYSVLWMPAEWLKLPRVILLTVRIAFPFFIIYILIMLAGLHSMIQRRKPVLIYIGLAVSWVMAASCALILFLQVSMRSAHFIVVMLFPMLLTLAGALLKAGRLTARSTVFLIVSLSIMPFYFGLVPYFSSNPVLGKAICSVTPGCKMQFGGDPESPAPGMRLLYPKSGQKSQFPLAFMREFYYDRGRGFLFSTYGPTCGFIRFHVPTGDLEIMKYKFLVRYLWSEDALPYVLAPDWHNADMLTLDKDSFKIEKRYDLYDIGINVSWNMAADENYVYLLSTELPLLARFERDTFKFAGKLDFKRLGLTPMRFGAYGVVLDRNRHNAFVNVGAYDLKYTFRLLRIDTNSFKVDASRPIRTGSTLMTILPSKGTLLTYDFYSNKVTEIDQETLESLRAFEGVFQCRAAAYDEARDLLYMVGYGLGEFKVIDYPSGKTIGNYHIGNKAGSLFFSAEEDALLVGSERGIYRVNLAELLPGRPAGGGDTE